MPLAEGRRASLSQEGFPDQGFVLSLTEGQRDGLSQEGFPVVCTAAAGSPLGAVSTRTVFKIKTEINK